MKLKKDPAATLDYMFDWSGWLADVSDTIETFELTADVGLTLGAQAESGGVITYWLSGGISGQMQDVTCEIETEGGRSDRRTMSFLITDR